MVEPIKATDCIVLRTPNTSLGKSEYLVLENNGTLYVYNFGMRVRIRDIASTILYSVNGKKVDTVGEALQYLGKKSDDDIFADALQSIDALVDEHENDTGMQHITDIKRVKSGDIIVTKSGRRFTCLEDVIGQLPSDYKLRSDRYECSVLKVRQNESDISDVYVYLKNTVFDYALHKVEIPVDDGFYKDCDGNIWELHSGTCASFLSTDALPEMSAPYTRMKLVEESED